MKNGPPLPLLLVGPLTVDYIDGERLPGGAVTYGATVASAFGVRARILTIGGPDADLSPLEGHDVQFVEADASVTFVFSPSERGRQMRVPERPSRPLSANDLPDDWRQPGTMLVAPLVQDDVDTASFEPVAAVADRVGVMTQGLQRELDDKHTVSIIPPREYSLVRTSSHSYTFFRSEREAVLWTDEQTKMALDRGARLVTTRGSAGAELRRGDRRYLVEPFPIAADADATGAGDVFATALILALGEGEQAAAQIAAAFAAASVEQVGPGPLPELAEIERRVAAGGTAANGSRRGAPA